MNLTKLHKSGFALVAFLLLGAAVKPSVSEARAATSCVQFDGYAFLITEEWTGYTWVVTHTLYLGPDSSCKDYIVAQ